ncbi:MAG: DNA-processing protein DprA, partial [Oscillospiraceae bacterium]
PQNKEMRESIIKNGAIISEFFLGTPAYPKNFPIRNRLISGISLATIIVQCTLKSGSLLTAAHALSQDRDIYAVTGNVFSKNSTGPLSLLKDGAMPYISAAEIMTHYKTIYKFPLKIPARGSIGLKSENNITKPQAPIKIKKEIPDNLSSVQKKILELLSEKSLQIDELSRLSEIPSYKLLAELTQLEILSLVASMPGGIYKLFEMSVF